MAERRAALEALEATGAPAEELLVPLAWLAAQDVPQDEEALNAAVRRAELLLATGGDPRRPLELDGRATAALAADLDSQAARAALARSLEALARTAEGLPATGEALRVLLGEGERAWSAYASAILVDALSET